jgi:hypothetical protein
MGDVNSGGFVSQGGLTVAVTAPRAYERAISTRIRGKDDGDVSQCYDYFADTLPNAGCEIILVSPIHARM